ncbi:MAG TPA: 3-hydroxyacyl-CoA dehydrogenase NAD-binding domain-containing protein, partial [Planctomycetota bacterium]|nr:3-hydroxyacyl-CoA dehydrogenase NAD-binding domain-containing protein [Planctomycetota bacterium]
MAENLPAKVAVVGAGTMGSGIAQAFAAVGVPVALIDVKDEFVQRGLATIQQSLARMVKKGTLTEDDAAATTRRVQGGTALDAAADATLVVEAV